MKKGAILSIVFFIIGSFIVFQFGHHSTALREQLEQERYSLMVAEEDLEKVRRKIDALQLELSHAQEKREGVQDVLKETKDINKILKARLDAATKAEEDLEKRIKEMEKLSAQVPAAATITPTPEAQTTQGQ